MPLGYSKNASGCSGSSNVAALGLGDAIAALCAPGSCVWQLFARTAAVLGEGCQALWTLLRRPH